MEKTAIRIAELLAKHLDNTLSSSEREELYSYLPAEKVEQLSSDFTESHEQQEVLNLYFESRKENVWKKINTKQAKVRSIHYKKYIVAAASIFLVATAAALWVYQLAQKSEEHVFYTKVIPDHTYGQKNDVSPGSNRTHVELANGKIVDAQKDVLRISIDAKPEIQMNAESAEIAVQRLEDIKTIKTPRTSNIKIILPDQSVVWLNSSSSLSLDPAFNQKTRQVKLIGEAYFQVAKMPSKPFKVIAHSDTVMVLGTSFNVNNYNKNNLVTLVEGSVSMRNERGNQVKLNPGYQAFTGRDGLQTRKVEVRKFISWKDGYFYFRHDRLKDVLAQLAAWYDIELDVKVEQTTSISGTIAKTATLAEAVSILSDVSGLKFRINNRILTISK